MRSPFFLLPALGVALLSVAAVGLLLNIPLNASGADLVRVDILVALMMAAAAIYFVTVRLVLQRAWPHQTTWMVIGPIQHDQFIWCSLVYVPATLLLLADLRPRLTIKFRRRVGLGDTVCPLRLP